MSYSAHHRHPLSFLRRVSNSLRSSSTLPIRRRNLFVIFDLHLVPGVVATFCNLVTILLPPILSLPRRKSSLLYGLLWRNRIEWLILYLVRRMMVAENPLETSMHITRAHLKRVSQHCGSFPFVEKEDSIFHVSDTRPVQS